MDKLINLIKDRQIGTWCKIGAWIVAAFGIIEVVLQARSLMLQSPNGALTPFVLGSVLSLLSYSLFSFLILYAAGVAINRFVLLTEGNATLEEDEEDDESVTVV